MRLAGCEAVAGAANLKDSLRGGLELDVTGERRADVPVSQRTKSDEDKCIRAFQRLNFSSGTGTIVPSKGRGGGHSNRGRAQGKPVGRRAKRLPRSFARSLEVLLIKDPDTEQFSVHVAIARRCLAGHRQKDDTQNPGDPHRLSLMPANGQAAQRPPTLGRSMSRAAALTPPSAAGR